MILTLKDNETVRETNWNDTVMTTMTREGNTVIVLSFNRYGSPWTRTMTY